MALRRLLLLLFICQGFSRSQSEEQILLDMSASGSELGWLTTDDGWEIVQTVVNGTLFYSYSVCNIDSPEQDNWLRTTFIQRRPGISRVSVELRFVVRDCNTFDGASVACKETFNLYISEADADVGTNFRKGQFRKVATIASDEVTHGRVLKVNAETRTVEPLSRRGFYLAFQDMGACVALLSARVYYKTCPSTVQSLAAFPETVADALKEVEGVCVENAISPATPRNYCSADGEWVVPVGQCQCLAGYESTGDSCQAVDSVVFDWGWGGQQEEVLVNLVTSSPLYKASSARSVLITPNPLRPDATECQCEEGFYRSPSDPPTSPCSAPPSAPCDLSSSALSAEGRLQLSWSPPLVTGGRSDLTYSVVCEHCNGGQCVPCGDKIRFEPGPAGLQDTLVVVTDLDAHLNYTFTVEAHSGVSQFSTEKAAASLTTALDYTDPPKVTFIHLDDRSATSLALSWTLSRRPPAHINHRYELMYRRKDDDGERDVTTYTVLILEKNSVQIADLTPDTTYIVRVQVLGSEVNPGSHSVEHEFQTSPLEGEQRTRTFHQVKNPHSHLCCFQVRSVRKDSHVFGPTLDQLKPLKTYVDPHMYEDPNIAIQKFVTEIDPSAISKQKVIGVGEFGEVFRGVMKARGRAEVDVAIKTLKPGYSEKQRLDFLSEASIMGQFSHPNIIRLEGVVTKFKHIMIVTEYMDNWSPGHVSEARNILVNSNLECKVSDFGLSRVLEDDDEGTYTTRGGKIPIRWTAPEAIAYRKFTSASDVWSFGIVMWEVMAFGERPYWDMSNHEVMKAINEAFRLPAPMDCPSAIYQLMLQCWQHDRSKRPRFLDIVNFLDKLLRSPESLKTIADFDPRVSIRLPSTSGCDGTVFRTVPEWLESIRMSQYSESFARAGITSMEQVLGLRHEDIRNIGVRLPGHLKRIAYSILGLKDETSSLSVFAV
ncbi:hypothetical protein fugu_005027 [Takifugu bimaculatus]|uniref:receptor protein-tyrosine kinase n=1 Tax=Takifugu bimaculatus TaxID=433685 RepID=A0A4Z2B8U9_9TELE|nr:hypothetical protein fugu_005027 [Takifugu bimaculatus]